MTENARTKSLRDAWKKRHPNRSYTEKINDASTGGRPDALFVHYGRCTWVEFKFPKHGERDLAQLTPLQKTTIREMTRAGANVYVGVYGFWGKKKSLRIYAAVGGEFDLLADGPEAEIIDRFTDYEHPLRDHR